MSTTETPRPSHTGRTIALIVAGVIITALVVWLAVGAVRTLTRPDASGTFEIGDRFDSVVLDGDLADVTVSYGAVQRGELTLRQGDTRERLELDHEVRGETLHVSLRHLREPGMPAIWWPSLGGRSPQLVLVLPESQEDDPVTLDLRTAAGDVEAGGDFGAVSVRSHVGDVELRGSADSLDVQTDAGEIDLVHFSTEGELEAHSAVGDVTLELAALPSGIRVETDLGDVEVDLPDGRYAVTTDTSLGEVDLAVADDPSAARAYGFTTNVGDISVRS
jgi:hypothetical protein